MIIIITKTETNSIKKTIKNTITNMIDLTKDKEIILTIKTNISIKFIKKQNMIKSICDVNKNYSG
jgi:ethanolamine utilization protein EutA (predicted chaperonin)